MTEPSSQDPTNPSDRPEGIGSISAATLSSLIDHLEARADLFRWEMGEARSRLVRRAGLLLAGAVMLVGAYAVGVAALVSWLAIGVDLDWPAGAGIVALGHLLIGTVFLLLARRGDSREIFPDSIAELRRDRELLRRRTDSTRPRDPK